MYGQQAGFRLPTNVRRYYETDLWSTYRFLDGTAVAGVARDVYTYQTGANGGNLAAVASIAETNMDEAGRIASGLAYTVRQVGIEPLYDDSWPVVGADLRNVANNLVPSWRFLNTEISIATTSIIGQLGGIFGSTADTGAVMGGSGGSRLFANLGAGTGWTYAELPVLLPANTTFALRLTFGSLAIVIDGGTNNSNLLIRVHSVGVATSAVPEG